MSGIARLFLALSTVAAIAAHAWLSPEGSALGWAGPAALFAGMLGGWLWTRGATTIAFGLAHVWPLIVFLLAGTVDPNSIVPWVALVTGLALVAAPVDRWSLPRAWHAPLAAWGLVLALGWPVVIWRELDFTLATYLQPSSTSGVWAGPARQTAAFLLFATLAQMSALLVVDGLWARYGRLQDGRFTRDIVWPMTAGTVVAIAVGIVQGLVDLHWLNVGVWPGLGRATGTFFDANAFGAVAALWGALAAGTLIVSRRARLVGAGAALLVASGIAVWVSGSRTALAGWVIVNLGLGAALVRGERVPRRALAAAVIVLLVLVAVGARVGGSGTAVHRFWETMPAPSVEGVTAFARDMWQRNGYGTAAVQIVREYPVTGAGPGAFQLFAPDYALLTTGSPIPPDNAQNWWRHQIAELGFLGSLPPLVCSLLLGATVIALLKRRRSDAGPQQTLVAGALVALGFMAMVGPPVAHPIVLETVAVTIVWAIALAASSEPGAQPALPRGAAALLVVALPLIWTGLTIRTAIVDLRPPYRAQHIGWAYGYGFSPPEPVAGGERRWAGARAVGVIPASGKRLALTLEVPRDRLTSGPVHVRVRDRYRVVLDTTRSTPDPFEAVIDVPSGEKWVMVQIDTDAPTDSTAAADRMLRVTARWVGARR